MLSVSPIDLEPQFDSETSASTEVNGGPWSNPASVALESSLESKSNAHVVVEQLVIIDRSVEGYSLLVDSLVNSDSGLLVLLIDSDRDGIEQISEMVSQHSDLQSIHVVSHGEAGAIQLGNTLLDTDNLASYAGEIASWNAALSADADILIYGCNLAATDTGQELVESIAALTGADVAASEDVTGHTELGGDWDFEFVVGTIDTEAAFSKSIQADWRGTLDITSNLVGHYEFDTTPGSTVDSTGNQNATASSGGIVSDVDSAVGDRSAGFSPDISGNSFYTVADNAAQDFGSGDFTVSLWYNQNGDPANIGRLIGDFGGAGNGFVIYVQANGAIDVQLHDGSTITESIQGIFDGTWNQLTVVRSGSTLDIYHNGVNVSSSSGVGGDIDSTNDLWIGASGSPDGDFDGNLDDVRLYTRALSSSDVDELVALGPAVATPPGPPAGYSNPTGGDNSLDHISNVTFAGINNNTGQDTAGYGNYTSEVASVSLGDSNSLSVTIVENDNNYVTAWVDWNQDGDFSDPGEEYAIVTGTSSPGPHTINIATPATATLGTTVMRIGHSWGQAPVADGGAQYREFEDYSINVFNPTINVDTTNDTVDGDTSSIASLFANKGADGFISLREAVLAANNTAGADTIVLGAGTYTLGITGTGEDNSATGDLDINTDITIVGDSATGTLIDATGLNDRVMEIRGAGALTVSNLTITGGASNSIGGGVFVASGGSLRATDVIFSDNHTSSWGGHISSQGTIDLERVALVSGSSGSQGGAIHVQSGVASLTNVTASGNTADDGGGAIWLQGGTLNLEHTTIANNSVTVSGSGGGIERSGGTANLLYSIIADNSASIGGDDISGAIVSSGYNIIEDSAGFSGTTGSDILGVDPGLAALAVVDGTHVHAIATSSNAYNAAAGSTETTDQRAQARGSIADIGAYEHGIEPTQSVPGAQSVIENEVLTFSLGNLNAITVSDTDATADTPLQVFISVNDGVLNLSQTTGLAILGGANGSSFMTIQGTESDLNAAFESMTFTPDTNFTGSVTLNMTTSLSAGMVGHYTFDSGTVSGSIVSDQSAGLSQDGTITGASVVTDTDRGDVLSLDGDDDFVQIIGLMGNPANVTLSAWINADSVDTLGAVVISLGQSPALYLDSDGTLIGFYESGGTNNIAQSTDSLVGTGWRHVAVSIDASSEMTIYVDGVATETMTPTGAIEYDNSPNTYIGRSGDGGGGFDFSGKIDDARIYSRALTSDEIRALSAENTTSSDNVSITVQAANQAPYFSSLPEANEVEIDGLSAASVVTTADLDNDGDLDIIAATDDGIINWYENGGGGNFGAANLIDIEQNFNSVVAYDLDGDGDMDIVALNDDPANSDGGVFVYTNNFFGSSVVSFTENSFEGTGGIGEQDAANLAIGDIDGNGLADLVVSFSASGSSSLIVFEQNTAGNWTKNAVDTFGTLYAVDIADLDGDTYLDIVVAEFNGSDELRWYKNDGNATAGFVSNVITTQNAIYDLQTGDVDGDGDADIVAVDWSTDEVRWYENSGGATPAFTTHTLDTGVTGLMYDVHLEDIEGDGDQDILVANKNANDLTLYENIGGQEFRKRNLDSNIGGIEWLETADIDGDGNLDVLAAATTADSVRVYYSYGDGYLVATTNEDVSANGFGIQIADDDAGAAIVEVAINVANGTMGISTTGLTVLSGGSGTSTLTVEGTIADINTALNSLSYTPITDFVGRGEIELTIDDRGNTGAGGAQTATETLYIDVLAQPDAVTDAHYTTWIGDSEFVVNTETTGFQDSPNVTALTGGGFVVVWESESQDGSLEGVYFQRYDAAGNAIGLETVVNTTTAGDQDSPEVIALAGGGFVIAWESAGQDADGQGVYLRVFDADGAATSAETQVNTTEAENQDTPHIAALSGGGFVVVWESYLQDGSLNGIYFQRFNDSGIAQGSETIVNATTSDEQSTSRVHGTSDGGFVVVWYDESSGDAEVKARRFNATGAAQSGEISVNTYTTGTQDDPDVVALSGGGFVVVWESTGQDGDGNGVYGQLFTSSGVASGSEFRVNSTTTNGQQDQRVEALDDGGFIVVWESIGAQDGDDAGSYAQQFDSSGAKVNGEFQLNTTTSGYQANPDVTILSDGRMVAVWNADLQDGSDDAIVGRILTPALNENSPAGTVAAVLSQIVDPDSGDTYTFTLPDSAGGAFDIQIDGSITVLDPSLIDFENGPTMTVTVRISDAASSSFHDEVVTINLNNLAEADHTVVGAQSMNEDGTFTFSGANSVSVTDTLAGTDALMQVSLSVNDGVLLLSQTTGIAFIEGVHGNSSFVINGTESAINAALDGMTFQPNPDFNGSVTLTMTTAIAAGLEGHYTFEGDANDQATGTADNGSLDGNAVIFTDAERGDVLSLDGTAGTDVQISTAFDTPTDLTAAAWVNATSGYSELISIGGSFNIRIDDVNSGRELTAFYYDGVTYHHAASGVAIAGTGWNHVAATFDDTTQILKLYLNGNEVASYTGTTSISYQTATSYLGSNTGGSLFLNGQIDDARIYSRALSVEEIAALATDQTTVTNAIAITVSAENDAPTNAGSTPADQAVIEDTASNLDLSSITLSDPDENGSGMSVTLATTSGGTLTASSGGGVTITGSGTNTIALDGTLADINTFLDNVTNIQFAGAPNAFGDNADAITVTVNDNGNSGAGGGTDQLVATVNVDITAVNDSPVIANLNGDTLAAVNDGVARKFDVSSVAFVVDNIDGTLDLDGGSLGLSGNSFEGLDTLGLDTSGAISLSAGFASGSVVSVGGVQIGTLSAVSSDAATISFNSNATITRVDALLQSFTFETTSATPGSRSVDLVLNDGDGTANGGSDTSATATVNISVGLAGNGLVSTNEDTTYTFTGTDFDFTGTTGSSLTKITVISLPSDGTLQLNGVDVVLNQEVAKAQIDAGQFTFVPDANENGVTYASFDFFVNDGKSTVNVLAGEPNSFTLSGGSLLPTDQIIQDANNFGLGGTFSSSITVGTASSTIDSTYLAQGSVLFGGYVPDGSYTTAELSAIDAWVNAGGVVISTNDSASYDDISNYYGLSIAGTASQTWNIADASHEIMNGPFGLVGNNGSSFTAAGSIGYFDGASLAPGDLVLATDSVTSEPTIVLRQVGDGWILFTGDEGIFRAAMTGGGSVTTPNDILVANIFAWAINSSPQSPQSTHQININVVAVNDAPVLDNSGMPSLPSITEDQIGNSGTTVASLLATGAGGDPISDVDGNLEGIAITVRNNGRGIWEYSVNGGTSWSSVGTVSDTSALLLRSTDLVRFNPDGENAPTAAPTIEFHAWDQTFGAAGTKVDVSINGGSTAFSSTIETASIFVTDVNDAPVLDNSGVVSLDAQAEDAGEPLGAVGTVISDLVSIGGIVSDVDASSQTGIAVTATDSSNGIWWYSIDGGTNWNVLGNVSDLAARVLNANSNTRIYFQSETDFAGIVNNAITFLAWDRSTGANGSLQDTSTHGGTTAFSATAETADITITSVNDAPQLVGPNIVANGQFDSGLAGWTATDNVDHDGTQARFGQIGGPNGTLSQTLTTVIGNTYTVSFDYGDASATAFQSMDVDLVGNSTLVDVSLTSGLTENTPQSYQYTFVADSTSTTITFTDTSANHSGVRGYLDNVTVVTDAAPNTAIGYTEGDGAVVIDNTLTIKDIDDTNIESAVVSISGNYANGEDVLAFANQNGITGAWNSVSGTLTLSGPATLAQYETALRSITFENTSENPATATRTVSFTVNDGDINSNAQTRDINVTAVNDEQVLSSNTGTTVAEGSTGTAITMAMLETTDVDNTNVQLVYTIGSATANGTVRLNGTSLGLNGTFTQADINAGNVTYDHNGSQTSADSFDFTVDDGSGATSSGTFNFVVTNVNDAPVNTVPGSQTVDEDNSLAITGISVADADDNLSTVQLSVNNGTLSVTLGSATISAGANGSNDLTLSGSLADINSALSTLTYQGNLNFNGSDTLTVLSTDSDSATDTDTISITVNAVNDTPTVTAPASALSVDEQTNLNLHGAGFSVADVDAATGTMTATLAVGEGDISVSAGDSGVAVASNNALSVSFTGTLTQINNLLSGSSTGTILYNNSSDTPSSSTNLTLTVNDGGNIGVDPGLTADAATEEGSISQTINITATNDDPTNLGTLPNDVTVTEDVISNIDLTAVNFGDADAGGSNLTVTLSTATGGELTLAADGNLTFGGTASARTITGSLNDLNGYFNNVNNIQYLHSSQHTFGNNADTVTVTINDNGNTGTGGGTDQTLGSVNIDITAVNDSPTGISPSAFNIDENTDTSAPVSIGSLITADPDVGDTFAYAIVPGDDGSLFSIVGSNNDQLYLSDGLLNFDIKPSYTVTVRSTDSGGLWIDQVATVTVNNLNLSPTVALSNVVLDITENANTSAPTKIADIVISDDADGVNTLSLSGADASNFEIIGSELFLRAGTVVDFESQTSFGVTVIVDDAAIGSTFEDSVDLTLNVNDLDDTAPVIQPGQVFTIAENSPIGSVLGSLVATDVDTTTPLTDWTLVAGNTNGSFQLNSTDGRILVANAESVNFENISTYTLTVSVSDGTRTSATETVTINILDANDQPIANGEQFATEQAQGIVVSAPGILVNDFDEDGNPLSAVLISGPSHGTLTLNPDGSFTYFPNESFFGTDSFVYQSYDGLTGSDSATVEISVSPLAPSGGGSGGTTTPTAPTNPPSVEVTPIPVVVPSVIDPTKTDVPPPKSGGDSGNRLGTGSGQTESLSASQQETNQLQKPQARQRSSFDRVYSGTKGKIYKVSTTATARRGLITETTLSIIPFSEHETEDIPTEQSLQTYLAGTTAFTSTTLSVGYVIWLLRGGSLAASLISTLPAWSEFDPLAVLDEAELDEDPESLLDIATGENGPKNPNKSHNT